MATNPVERIALDSVVVIDLLDQKPGRYDWIKPIVKGAEDRELLIVVCAMGVAETVEVPGKTADQSRAIIKEFFDKSWIFPVAVTMPIGESAAEIQRTHRVDCADAVHLAAAIQSKSPFFLTNDGDSPTKKKRKSRPLLVLDKQLNGLDGNPLRIVTPQTYHQIQVAKQNPLFSPS